MSRRNTLEQRLQFFRIVSHKCFVYVDWLCWGLTTRQPFWVILCRLPEKGRKETEEIAEEMKERDREERGTGMKVKKQKKWKHHLPTLTCYKDSRPCPPVSQYQLDAPVTWYMTTSHHPTTPCICRKLILTYKLSQGVFRMKDIDVMCFEKHFSSRRDYSLRKNLRFV